MTGSSRGEVATKLGELRRQVDAGLPVGGGAMTVADLLTRWVNDVLPTKVEPGTVEGYRWAIDKHLVPALGATRLVKLTPEQVERFLAAKSATLGRASLIRLRAVLGQALRWAEKRGYVARNAAGLADLPAVTRAPKEGRALTGGPPPPRRRPLPPLVRPVAHATVARAPSRRGRRPQRRRRRPRRRRRARP